MRLPKTTAPALAAALALTLTSQVRASEPETEPESEQPVTEENDATEEHGGDADTEPEGEGDSKPVHEPGGEHHGEGEHEPEGGDHGVAEHHGEGEQGHAHRFFVGAKGTYLLSFPHGEIHHLGGGGVFFELVLVQRWLEMEFSLKGLTGGHGAVMPIEVLLKIPFHVNDVFHPFVGLGPAVVPSFGEENEVFFGGVAEVGAHIWVHRSWAIVAALGYGLIYEHGLVNEAAVNLGFAYGW